MRELNNNELEMVSGGVD
ncbi:bacteriocin [Salmonella enterica]|uniref:Bacteriocin n=1 Tax=Salmonella enterica TaxID=28901 RepID=A0A5V1AGL4_SALER|nr:bacteriocin [Salmonella enterica]EDG0478550.1 bacteriocin [Salmonella enterica subsp. enterica serovar Newport]EDS5051610.1 bacteriocin [Salmonella enterica subsp. enterica serovar Javiana]EAV1366463.1 bacteriocin [Salmonella enterica]EBB0765546.1 bacteriocin [Salmonella enterica]